LSSVALGLAVLGVAGCRTTDPKATAPDRDASRIHDLIKSKVDGQDGRLTGDQRWRELSADVYQSPGDLAGSRARRRAEEERRGAAETLLRAGPVALHTCLAFSLEFNDTVQAQRAALRAVVGEEIVNRARFLPSLTYSLSYESTDPRGSSSTNDTHQSVRLSQTILEFGKDNEDDVALRESQRDALFDYEDTVRDTLSQVRKEFFTLILRRQQLKERETSLQEFRRRYEKIVELEKTRRVLEVDVLTARLNMLNEEARINSLEKETFRRKSDLLYLMGFPVGLTDLEVEGAVEGFGMPLEDAVNIALERSPEIAEERANAAEQARVVAETFWDYMPSIGLQTGWQDDENAAGLQLGTSERVYSLSTYAEAHTDSFDGYLENESELLDEGVEGWFVDLSVALPVFEGLERRGTYRKEKALLDQARHLLRDKTDSIELEVRKVFQTMLEDRQQVEILRETVDISRRRLRVQERLKELGKISDNQLETFRTAYFEDQDRFFSQQITLINAQENLRYVMRYFEPLPTTEE